MAVISELIRSESDGTISFGDYSLEKKAKLDDFDHRGETYKVKTYKEITKLEKNGMFAYESVPGTTVTNFCETESGITFTVEGDEDAQITVGLAEEAEYEVTVGPENVGRMKTNLGGKLSMSVELGDAPVDITIKSI
jgi:hypothetical protein